MATYDRPSTPPAFRYLTLSRPVCSLPVSDIPAAIDYWTSKLPFYLRGRDGDNHCWVQSHTPGSDVNVYLRRRGFSGPGRPLDERDASMGKIYIRVAGSEIPDGEVEKAFRGGDGEQQQETEEEEVERKGAAAEDAVRNLSEVLKGRGAMLSQPAMRMPWGHWVCAFEDPDGNVITFYAEAPIKRRTTIAG